MYIEPWYNVIHLSSIDTVLNCQQKFHVCNKAVIVITLYCEKPKYFPIRIKKSKKCTTSYRSIRLHAVDYRIKLLLKFQDCNTTLETETLLFILRGYGHFLEHTLIFSLGYIIMSPRDFQNEKK